MFLGITGCLDVCNITISWYGWFDTLTPKVLTKSVPPASLGFL
ncbi:hypothetical protein B6N60_05059 [Richelia sinica FACHB-800]|uniref:Uncharacterized protein n=1 Tax=Richelia sinica FACHB-800 TaxID=1357546 RepID=A0A975TCL0_9NOST|nr:hypothetical protein B6N60_05059 [Richelia sinica FACHB-800]